MRPLTSNEKLALALIAFCLMAAVVGWPKREPEWNGRTLQEWLKVWEEATTSMERNGGSEAILKQRGEAEDAIYSMGPTVVPRLIAVVEAQDPPMQAKLAKWSESAGWTSHPFAHEAKPRRAAIQGLVVHGPASARALPMLSNELFHSEAPWDAAAALVSIGTPAMPVFLACLTNSKANVKAVAHSGLIGLGTNASAAEPALHHLLLHPDSAIRGRALSIIASVKPAHENSIPFLLSFRSNADPEVRAGAMNGLAMVALKRGAEAPGIAEAAAAVAQQAEETDADSHRRAAWMLQHFKSAAAPHIPTLLRLLKDPSDHVRHGAVVSLVSLKLRLPEIIPALADMLADPKQHIQEEAAAGLREMAAEAEKIQPGLIGSLGDLGKARYEHKRAWVSAYERSEAKRIERMKAKPEAKK